MFGCSQTVERLRGVWVVRPELAAQSPPRFGEGGLGILEVAQRLVEQAQIVEGPHCVTVSRASVFLEPDEPLLCYLEPPSEAALLEPPQGDLVQLHDPNIAAWPLPLPPGVVTQINPAHQLGNLALPDVKRKRLWNQQWEADVRTAAATGVA